MSPLHQYPSPSTSILLLSSTSLLLLFPSSAQNPAGNLEAPVSFHLSIVVVIGVFSIMFSLTFLLLMYVKFCHPSTTPTTPIPSIIDSLPFFLFSSLKGSHHGLECSVCLSKFGNDETLRLLPKCKHVFHVACVDRWLESHSTCPLCRHRVDPHNAEVVKLSTSWRFLNVDTNTNNDKNLENVEIFVEREKMNKFRHRIVVSDVMLKSRWSDVDLSDIEAMSSDLLIEEEKGERGRDVRNICISEIEEVSRFEARVKNGLMDNGGDEKVRRVWLPIARRTVEWFAGRERERRRDGGAMEDRGGRVDSNV